MYKNLFFFFIKIKTKDEKCFLKSLRGGGNLKSSLKLFLSSLLFLSLLLSGCSKKAAVLTEKSSILSTSSSEFLGLLKTGQTKSYKNYDDGYYKKGITRNYTRKAGIVTDHITGLQWQDNYPNSKNGKVVKKTWLTQKNYKAKKYYGTSGDTASTYCKNLRLGGYSDWRLPSINELLSIVDDSNSSVFEKTAQDGYCWSSTSSASTTSRAWAIHFSHGGSMDDGKYHSYYVRCVRAGQ